jgi:hypothetical protein
MEMQQVRLVACGVVTKPLINVCDRDLMEHGEAVARGLLFIGDDGRSQKRALVVKL